MVNRTREVLRSTHSNDAILHEVRSGLVCVPCLRMGDCSLPCQSLQYKREATKLIVSIGAMCTLEESRCQRSLAEVQLLSNVGTKAHTLENAKSTTRLRKRLYTGPGRDRCKTSYGSVSSTSCVRECRKGMSLPPKPRYLRSLESKSVK